MSQRAPANERKKKDRNKEAYQAPSVADEDYGELAQREDLQRQPAPSEEQQSIQDEINEAIRRLTVTHEDVVIAVMGMTGVGKSTFISYLTPEEIHIGHTLKAGTTIVKTFSCPYTEGRTIHLIDTPGFNDPKKSDAQILELVSVFMSALYTQNIKLAGVIYLHPINDVRMYGSSSLNLELFEELCGKDGMKKTILATTKWDCLPSREVGERREQELKDEFWSEMILDGSEVFRQDSGVESAMRILDYLMNLEGEGLVTTVAPQLVDQGLQHKDTNVGKVLRKDQLKIEADHLKKVERLEAKHADAIKKGDQERADAIAAEQAKVASAIEKHKADMKIMERTLSDSQQTLRDVQKEQKEAKEEKTLRDKELKDLREQNTTVTNEIKDLKKEKTEADERWKLEVGRLEKQMQKDKDEHLKALARRTEEEEIRPPKKSLGAIVLGLTVMGGSAITLNPVGLIAGASIVGGGMGTAAARLL